MSVGPIKGIEPVNANETGYVNNIMPEQNNLMTNSIFGDTSSGVTKCDTMHASSGLIDKMQAFFEGLETREFDPRFSEFSSNSGGWNDINYYEQYNN